MSGFLPNIAIWALRGAGAGGNDDGDGGNDNAPAPAAAAGPALAEDEARAKHLARMAALEKQQQQQEEPVADGGGGGMDVDTTPGGGGGGGGSAKRSADECADMDVDSQQRRQDDDGGASSLSKKPSPTSSPKIMGAPAATDDDVGGKKSPPLSPMDTDPEGAAPEDEVDRKPAAVTLPKKARPLSLAESSAARLCRRNELLLKNTLGVVLVPDDAKVNPREQGVDRSCGQASAQFVDIPNDAMLLVAEFLPPTDVYSICLTNKGRFFQSAGNHMSEQSGESSSRGGLAPNAIFCTKLLRFSLLANFNRALQKSKSGISLEQMKPFSNMTHGSAIITGSIMVQTVLGEFWGGGDIDIFCTNEIAPAVRSWLVKEAHQLCQGFNDHYIGVNNLARLFLTKIHHVEHYMNVPKEGKDYGWNGLFKYEDACRYGSQINTNFPRRWQRALLLGDYREFCSSKYHVKPLAGDPFPFNWMFTPCHGEDGEPEEQLVKPSFDVVVAKDGSNSPLDLLEDFDLAICKMAWDGENFLIADPHYSFRKRSKIEPSRLELMNAYQVHYKAPGRGYGSGQDAIEFARIRDAVQLMGLMTPHPNLLLQEYECFCIHNFIFKLFDRLKKYQGRGIEVENAPNVQDFKIRGFDTLTLSDGGELIE